jgi:hypothetical protein
MITRILQKALEKRLFRGKALLVFGARQTGKSTLAKNRLSHQQQEWTVLNGDDHEEVAWNEIFFIKTCVTLKLLVYL